MDKTSVLSAASAPRDAARAPAKPAVAGATQTVTLDVKNMMPDSMPLKAGHPETRRWYADRAARLLIGSRYVPWIAALNLAWEIAQLPLYTLWTEASVDYMAFAVVHCTLGDVIIALAALAVALIVTRAPELARWRWGPIAAATAIGGAAYTVFSEWLNTVAVHSWAYSQFMPVVPVLGAEIGLVPLAQWLLLPPLALLLARSR